MSTTPSHIKLPECVQYATPLLESAKTILITGGFWSKESEMGVIVGPFIQRTCLSESAPELLEALQELLYVQQCADETGYVDGVGFVDVDSTVKKAEAAIAKATGGK